MELPEAYGTGRLLLAARDPHWLYAHWDMTREQIRECNASSIHGHLVLRIYEEASAEAGFLEVHVHPESRNWFVEVSHANARYHGELGYYSSVDRWVSVAVSSATLTPPETLAAEGEVEFATIPMEMPFEELFELVKAAVRENVPLTEAMEQLRASGHPDLPTPEAFVVEKWTPAQTQALEEVLVIDEVRRVWIGSLEVTQWVAQQWRGRAPGAPQAGPDWFSWAEAAGGPEAVTSPMGGERPAPPGFWFNVNAEVILYGATEPDARVTIGGKRVVLRRDGTFSYRFAFPDGRFELPVAAVSRSGVDGRQAEFEFSRATSYSGAVGTHPQDPALRPPRPEHLA